jgi:hypothetical protein
MPSRACAAFDENAKDVDRLLKIHSDVGGDQKGRRYGLEVLNKSAIVLITAIWEAYCEDLSAEALEHIVTNAAVALDLPKELRKQIASEVRQENELAMWDLADGGWKTKAKSRLTRLTAERNWRLNSPKAEQLDQLFFAAIGLSNISHAWKWKRMPAETARTKLDEYVKLRGSIAHRGAAAAGVKKWQVQYYIWLVKQLVTKTDGRVNMYLKATTGSTLW